MGAVFKAVLLLLALLVGGAWSQLESEYALLGVSASDDLVAIKRAHRKLALANHPDKNPTTCSSSASSSTSNNNCTDALAKINAAYDKIVYARKATDAPELAAFFGFSVKLYNLVHDVWGLWERIPQADKDDVASSWDDYRSSGTFEEDIQQGMILLNRRIAQLLEDNRGLLLLLIALPLLQMLCSLVGLLYLLSLLLRPCLWLVRTLLALVYPLARRALGVSPKTYGAMFLRPVVGGVLGAALLWAALAARECVRVPVLSALVVWAMLPLSLLLSLYIKDE